MPVSEPASGDRMRRLPVLALIILTSGGLAAAACGSSLRKQQAQRLAEADALFTRGCYVCLTQAYAAYDALRLAGYQPATVTAKAFDTAILLAVREKELGMAAEPWLAKADALSKTSAGLVRPRANLYLDMASKARWAAGRLDADQASKFERAVAAEAIAALRTWETALGPAPERDLVGTYLMASLACSYTPPSQQLSQLVIARLAPAHRNAPLIRYIVGICRPELAVELDALASDPDFHELLYQRGRMRLFQVDPAARGEAKALLAEAFKRMPEAAANTNLLAGLHLSLEEFADCAARYDDVIRHGGAERDSMLDRTKCLTRGAFREKAIASATELIDSPGAHQGEARFYRAWNRYHLKQLPLARADVDMAKGLWVNGDVFALSGFIAYDMDQKDFAYTEFREALQLNSDYCVAAFYQGLIDATRERWSAAGDRYEAATHCYGRSVGRLSGELRRAEALPADDPTRSRRIANLTEGLEAERLQHARAAYNAAYSYGKSGDAAKGIPFAMQSAIAHHEMEKLAAELLEILRKGG
jgi:hypothetical protein